MQFPWHDLKKAELAALSERRSGRISQRTLPPLRKLVAECQQDPDADARICYHGSLALLFEADRDWSSALKHRQLEMRKIRRLYELERQNPTDGYATQNYQEKDLRERRAILEQIKCQATTKPPSGTPKSSS